MWPSPHQSLDPPERLRDGTREITAHSLSGDLLTKEGYTTLGDFCDEFEGLGETIDDDRYSSTKRFDLSNKVLDQIDLDNWVVTGPHEDLPVDTEYGVIRGRYSSEEQNETGCVGRMKDMLDEAERRNIPLYTDPIIDIAQSGKTSELEGLRKAVRLVQHPQVKYFFVHDLSRLARWNSFCMFLVDLFTREFDIEVITDYGPLNLDRLEGLATTWVTSMAAEMENRNKAKNTLGGLLENFEQGNYKTWYDNIRLGYSESDEDLLEVDQSEVDIAQEAFQIFAEAHVVRPYAETCEVVNEEYDL